MRPVRFSAYIFFNITFTSASEPKDASLVSHTVPPQPPSCYTDSAGDMVSVTTLICSVQTAVCGSGGGQPSPIGRSRCLMKLIRHKHMRIELLTRYNKIRLNRKPSHLDFLPCWISDLCAEVISLVRAWRIMWFDVYICPGVYVCVPLSVPS